MRTTLTLDDDVVAQLDRLRNERKVSLKQIVNDTLRAGLAALKTDRQGGRFSTRTRSLGRCLIGDVNDVHGVLSLVEGEDRP